MYFIQSCFLKMILMREEGEGREGEEGEEADRGFVQWMGTGDENCVFYWPVIWGIYLSHLCLRFPTHEMGQLDQVNLQLSPSFKPSIFSFQKRGAAAISLTIPYVPLMIYKRRTN